MTDITAIFNFVLSQLSGIWNLFISGSLVFTLALALYILDKLFGIFDVLRR